MNGPCDLSTLQETLSFWFVPSSFNADDGDGRGGVGHVGGDDAGVEKIPVQQLMEFRLFCQRDRLPVGGGACDWGCHAKELML